VREIPAHSAQAECEMPEERRSPMRTMMHSESANTAKEAKVGDEHAVDGAIRRDWSSEF
jgi:hypothetical protein